MNRAQKNDMGEQEVFENIRLKEAMEKEIADGFGGIWVSPGCHIKVDDIPVDAIVERTFVTETKEGYNIGIVCSTKGRRKASARSSAEKEYFPKVLKTLKWEELQEELPNLFELEGVLLIFGLH